MSESDSRFQSLEEAIVWLREYARTRLNSYVMSERRMFPPNVILDLGSRGLMGVQVAKEDGGLGWNCTDTLKISRQLGAIDLTLSLFIGLNNILAIRPVMHFAKPELRQELLPQLARGRKLAAFALTEPSAGSNPRAISATATPIGPGRWRLDGEKVWSGAAAWASVINTFVWQLDEDGASIGMTGFAVPQDAKGVVQGPEAMTTGMRATVQNTFILKSVEVTEAQMLGAPGEGLDVAQDAMMFGRLAMAAGCVGSVKRAVQMMLRYGERRNVSTGQLASNPAFIATAHSISASILAVEHLMDYTSATIDAGKEVAPEVYTALKVLAPEIAWTGIDTAAQYMGGRGYMDVNLLSQFLRDVRSFRIFEGPTETLQHFLGAKVLREKEAFSKLLREEFGAPQVFAEMEVAFERIRQRFSSPKYAFDNEPALAGWIQFASGAVAAYGLMHAACLKADKTSQATEWSRVELKQRIYLASSGSSITSNAFKKKDLETLVKSFEDSIGTPDQETVGEALDWDPLLV